MSPLFSFLLCLIAQFCQISFLLPLSKIFILLILRYIVSHLFSFMSFPFVVICSFKLFVTCLFPVIFIHMSKIIVLQKIKRGLHSLVKNDLGLGKGLGRDVMCGIKQFVEFCVEQSCITCPASSGLTALNIMPISRQEVSGPQGGFMYLTGTVLLVHFPSDDLSYQLKRWLFPLPWKIRACFSSGKRLISLSDPCALQAQTSCTNQLFPCWVKDSLSFGLLDPCRNLNAAKEIDSAAIFWVTITFYFFNLFFGLYK